MEYAEPVVRAGVRAFAPAPVASLVEQALDKVSRSIADARLAAEFARERDAISASMSCIRDMTGDPGVTRELENLIDALSAAGAGDKRSADSRLESVKTARERFQANANMMFSAAAHRTALAANYAARRPWTRLLRWLKPPASSADEYKLLTAFANPRLVPSPVTASDHARWSQDLPAIYLDSLIDSAVSPKLLSPEAAAANFLAHLRADEDWRELLADDRALTQAVRDAISAGETEK